MKWRVEKNPKLFLKHRTLIRLNNTGPIYTSLLHPITSLVQFILRTSPRRIVTEPSKPQKN